MGLSPKFPRQQVQSGHDSTGPWGCGDELTGLCLHRRDNLMDEVDIKQCSDTWSFKKTIPHADASQNIIKRSVGSPNLVRRDMIWGGGWVLRCKSQAPLQRGQ